MDLISYTRVNICMFGFAFTWLAAVTRSTDSSQKHELKSLDFLTSLNMNSVRFGSSTGRCAGGHTCSIKMHSCHQDLPAKDCTVKVVRLRRRGSLVKRHEPWLNSMGEDESRILNLGSLSWRKQRLHRPPRERNHLVCYSRAWQRLVTSMNSPEDMLREGKRLDNTSNQQFPGSRVLFSFLALLYYNTFTRVFRERVIYVVF